MKIRPDQIKVIQTFFSKAGVDRDGRLEVISDYFTKEILTIKDLSESDAASLFFYLNTGQRGAYAWALFDRENKQHMAVLNRCYELNWVEEYEPRKVDLNRLGNWLQHKSPVRLSLKKMDPTQLSTVIYALSRIRIKQLS